MKSDIKRILDQYKFCFVCGEKLKYVSHNHFKCTVCEYNPYVNPTFCTGAILENEKGEILLVERKVDPGKGLWDIPGGFVDLEESIEEGILRELQEELGITPHDLKYFTSEPDTYVWDGITLATVGLVFIGKIKDREKIRVTDDVAGYKFFKPSKIPFERIAFKGVVSAVKKYVNGRK